VKFLRDIAIKQAERRISAGNISKGEGCMTYKTSQAAKASCASLTLPAQLMPFSKPSLLLPGENLRDFEIIRQMMVDDIQPETNTEWLWTLDLVELSWEILRYRNLKNRILDAHRAAAIAAILQRLDGEGRWSLRIPT
jgi:hypothetical protein